MNDAEKDTGRRDGSLRDGSVRDGSVQDGAVKPAQTLPETSPTAVQNQEPEDAYLTGGQRNLQRRVLGLNVDGHQGQRPAGQSPGLHANGSFTGTGNGQTGTDPEADTVVDHEKDRDK